MSERKSFEQRLREGLPYQEVVRDMLLEQGIPCITDMRVLANRVDECDLDCEGRLVEVKSLSAIFTGVEDWPFREVFIDTVSTWERKRRERLAIVNISRATAGVAVLFIPPTRPHWYVTRRHDRVRQIDDDFYAVAREHLRPFSDLVATLKQTTMAPDDVETLLGWLRAAFPDLALEQAETYSSLLRFEDVALASQAILDGVHVWRSPPTWTEIKGRIRSVAWRESVRQESLL